MYRPFCLYRAHPLLQPWSQTVWYGYLFSCICCLLGHSACIFMADFYHEKSSVSSLQSDGAFCSKALESLACPLSTENRLKSKDRLSCDNQEIVVCYLELIKPCQNLRSSINITLISCRGQLNQIIYQVLKVIKYYPHVTPERIKEFNIGLERILEGLNFI